MKASELINKLQVMIDKYGDKPMCILACDMQEIETVFDVINGDDYGKQEYGKYTSDYFFLEEIAYADYMASKNKE